MRPPPPSSHSRSPHPHGPSQTPPRPFSKPVPTPSPPPPPPRGPSANGYFGRLVGVQDGEGPRGYIAINEGLRGWQGLCSHLLVHLPLDSRVAKSFHFLLRLQGLHNLREMVGLCTISCRFIIFSITVDENVHGWCRAQVEHLFARSWHWHLVKNILFGSQNELHHPISVLLHFVQFCIRWQVCHHFIVYGDIFCPIFGRLLM